MRAICLVSLGILCGLVAFGEPNDTPAGASSVELDRVTCGTLNPPWDSVDWWKVYVPRETEILVFIDGIQGNDIDLYFYDAGLNLGARSTGGGEDEVVYGRVPKGWYYIKVQACYTYRAPTNYYLAVLTPEVTGYLRGRADFDLYERYMRSGCTYWIFITDHSDLFDPDLFLAYRDEVLAASQNEGNIDVIKWTPGSSGRYVIAVGSYRGSGYYYLFIASRCIPCR